MDLALRSLQYLPARLLNPLLLRLVLLRVLRVLQLLLRLFRLLLLLQAPGDQ